MPASLPTRKIGKHDVSAIGYGAMGLAVFYGQIPDDEQRLKFLDELYESGCHNWDSADVYGDSEEILGKWFARTGKRKDIFLATKFGVYNQGGRHVNGSPEYMHQQFEKSLKRFQTDHIDLYYLHRPDPTIPIEETVTAMASLVKAGKVTYLGLSECSATTLRRAHAVHPITAIQVEYSPFALDIEDPKIGLLATARELGVAVIAYSPLGRGMLTGRYRSREDLDAGDRRLKFPRFSAENFPRINTLVDGLGAIGQRFGATAGQVALAWVLAQGSDVIPIPGTKSVKYLEENLGALNLNLTEDDLAAVRKQAQDADVAAGGERYPADMVAHLFGDTPELKKA